MIRLTQYSSGAGCGCKIAPRVLDEILGTAAPAQTFPQLLVGNEFRDDAAAWLMEDGAAVLCDSILTISRISSGGPPAKPRRQPVMA